MGSEPITFNTAIKEALSAAVKVLVVFGVVVMSTEQFGALMLAIDPILAVIFLLWNARRQSTSIVDPRVPEGTVVTSYDPATGDNNGETVATAGPAVAEPGTPGAG